MQGKGLRVLELKKTLKNAEGKGEEEK